MQERAGSGRHWVVFRAFAYPCGGGSARCPARAVNRGEGDVYAVMELECCGRSVAVCVECSVKFYYSIMRIYDIFAGHLDEQGSEWIELLQRCSRYYVGRAGLPSEELGRVLYWMEHASGVNLHESFYTP